MNTLQMPGMRVGGDGDSLLPPMELGAKKRGLDSADNRFVSGNQKPGGIL